MDHRLRRITFANYPFFPATVFPAATIAWEQTDDITAAPFHHFLRPGAPVDEYGDAARQQNK